MGGSIAAGLAAGNMVGAGNITVTAKTEKTLANLKSRNPELHLTLDNTLAVEGADFIMVAVKPWQAEAVLQEIRPHLDYSRQHIVSIVAGIPFRELESMLGNGSGIRPSVFRVIPNTAVSVKESMTFIASNGKDTGAAETLAALFGELGRTVFVPEAMMAAGTSLASCGIAFAFKYMDAAIKAGTADGFSGEEARSIVMQTVRGALCLMEEDKSFPQEEIDKVTTPGGLTAKGLEAMEKGGFTEAVISGIEKSR